jgi:DNA-binding response OmpR family regulator
MEMKKYKVLIIEDDAALQEAVTMKLDRAGFNSISALSAEQGIEHLSKNQVDFIWLDMYLPGMSGLQFLEQIRQMNAHKETPVMIVSAYSSDESKKRAFELNILNFVSKIDNSIKDIVSLVCKHFNKETTGGYIC